MKHFYTVVTVMVLFIAAAQSGCNSLGKKDTVSTFHYLEKEEYVLRKNVNLDEKRLEKGDKIRVIITYDKDWIKVHGYRANVNPLEAERVLLLYLFVEEFPEEKFSQSYFEEKFYEIVKPIPGT